MYKCVGVSSPCIPGNIWAGCQKVQAEADIKTARIFDVVPNPYKIQGTS